MTHLPEGFVRLPQSGDVVSVDHIAAVHTKCHFLIDLPTTWSVIVQTKGGHFKFQLPAKDEQDAGLLRDEIVRDMWRAKRPAVVAEAAVGPDAL